MDREVTRSRISDITGAPFGFLSGSKCSFRSTELLCQVSYSASYRPSRGVIHVYVSGILSVKCSSREDRSG